MAVGLCRHPLQLQRRQRRCAGIMSSALLGAPSTPNNPATLPLPPSATPLREADTLMAVGRFEDAAALYDTAWKLAKREQQVEAVGFRREAAERQMERKRGAAGGGYSYGNRARRDGGQQLLDVSRIRRQSRVRRQRQRLQPLFLDPTLPWASDASLGPPPGSPTAVQQLGEAAQELRRMQDDEARLAYPAAPLLPAETVQQFGAHGFVMVYGLVPPAMVHTLRRTGWGFAEATSDRRDSMNGPPVLLLGDPSGVHAPWKARGWGDAGYLNRVVAVARQLLLGNLGLEGRGITAWTSLGDVDARGSSPASISGVALAYSPGDVSFHLGRTLHSSVSGGYSEVERCGLSAQLWEVLDDGGVPGLHSRPSTSHGAVGGRGRPSQRRRGRPRSAPSAEVLAARRVPQLWRVEKRLARPPPPGATAGGSSPEAQARARQDAEVAAWRESEETRAREAAAEAEAEAAAAAAEAAAAAAAAVDAAHSAAARTVGATRLLGRVLLLHVLGRRERDRPETTAEEQAREEAEAVAAEVRRPLRPFWRGRFDWDLPM
eukprot:COSAG01_NODE_3540_length_5957_cov_540.355241_4_plen_547_part_00